MTFIELTNLETLVAGLATYVVGKIICRALPFLGRMDLPISVVGGLIVAVALAGFRYMTGKVFLLLPLFN